MRKSVEWIRNNRFVATIIAVLSVVAVAILVVFIFGVLGCIDLNKTTSAGELLRTFILCIGAIGGVYGLHLAIERQKTFSDQVDVQTEQMQSQSKQVQVHMEQVKAQVEQVNVQSKQVQVLSKQVQVQADQSFNDRLGRGVELLAKDDLVMRCAGLQILEDLADNANVKQRRIVLNIIYNFFCDSARAKYDSNKNHRVRSKEKTTQDLQDALDILINLSLNDRKKLLPKRLIDDRLNFSKLDFSHLSFSSQALKNIDFSESKFDETTFNLRATIENVNFHHAKIEGVKLSGVEIKNSHFKFTEIAHSWFISCVIGGEKTTFTNVTIEKAYFSDSIITCRQFSLVKFIGGTFTGGTVKVSPTSDLPSFIGVDLSDTSFDFDGDIDLSDFLHLYYYRESQQLSKMDASRRYISTLAMKVFVESDEPNKPWSGQPVEARIALEIAEWKLEQTRETSTDIDKQKKDIAALANELKAAEAKLQRRRDKFNNP